MQLSEKRTKTVLLSGEKNAEGKGEKGGKASQGYIKREN